MNIHWRLAGKISKPLLAAMSRRRLPQIEGEITVSGIREPVSILRDSWGIPHIRAKNRADLYFAQGFVHAQDRLFQMEINRRAATGRLAEIFGPLALATDRLTRTLGISRVGQAAMTNTTERVLEDVAAYTKGVNAYLESTDKLPVEFFLLRHTPEPWTEADSAAFGRLVPWPLTHVWAGKLVRAKLIEAVGPEFAAELEPYYPERNPITLPNGIEFNRFTDGGKLQPLTGPFLGKAMKGSSPGSNAWVISAALSTTGRALLANDMHLPVTTPSLWYCNHLYAQNAAIDGHDLHVTGVSLPGVPYVMVGHNEKIAWGATVSFIDCEDLFLERFDPADSNRYLFQDSWHDADVYRERIKVKGQADHVETVRVTRHGPIIDAFTGDGKTSLALQSKALQPVESFEGFARLNEAHGWDEFVLAIKELRVPTLNILYADVDDNIGYYVCGEVPIRANGQGTIPVPGWTAEHEWIGNIPLEEMPHALNPRQGYIVSANHRIIDDEYPYYLGVSWRNGYRAKRITELIKSYQPISPSDCQNFQVDVLSLPGLELALILANLETENPDAKISLDSLCGWDGQLNTDSIGGSVYEVLLQRLAKALLIPKLGPELTSEFLGNGLDPALYPVNELHGQWPATIIRLLDNPESGWWPKGESVKTILVRCLAETTEFLRQFLGDDTAKWRWGRLNQIRFDHVLAAQAPFERIFSHGPFPVGGDSSTVLQSAIIDDNPGDNVAPSYRQIIDLGDMANARGMVAPGQSGQLGSPHYGDMVQPWLTGQAFPLTWDRADLVKAAVRRLHLRPSQEE